MEKSETEWEEQVVKLTLIDNTTCHWIAGPQTAKPNTSSSSSRPASDITVTVNAYQNIMKTEGAEKKG